MSTYDDVEREARESWADREPDDRPTLAELNREEAEANDYPEPRGCSEFDYPADALLDSELEDRLSGGGGDVDEPF